MDVGRNVQNGTNFNLTLCVCGLSTSVTFPVIVQGEWCGCGFLEETLMHVGKEFRVLAPLLQMHIIHKRSCAHSSVVIV